MLVIQTPPAAQAPTPTPVTPATTLAPLAGPTGPFTAREMHDAAKAQRRVIRDQLNGVESERDQVADQLRDQTVVGPDREGLEQQLRTLDIRILDLRQQLADAQRQEAQTAAIPGSTDRTPQEIRNDRFEVTMVVGTLITLAIAIPLTIAYARRLWKKAAVTVSMTPELDRRLDSIDRALETTALEVERIGEGQRFVTQLLANRAEQETAKAFPPEAR